MSMPSRKEYDFIERGFIEEVTDDSSEHRLISLSSQELKEVFL